MLGGVANFCEDFATKRYRSNVINWGMLPFTVENIASYDIQPGDRIYIAGIRKALEGDAETIEGVLLQGDKKAPLPLKLERLTREERDIILSGCLINYYA